ncbi:MAG TPA: neutral zinc metallopeptidase [Acidimicrobiales bacterium]|nr:neutral zinc metallopeptidase [Acidimicrobiales bacterium]
MVRAPSSGYTVGVRWRRTESQHYRRRGGRGLGLPMTAGGGVIGLIVLLATVLLGGGSGGVGGLGETLESDLGAPATEEEEFVEFLAEDTQAVWADIFTEDGRQYSYATVNSFTGQVSTGCGAATSAVGPFYCPADGQVYLDLGFFDELRSRFGAPGDFAQAYVVAHEVGHHVQNLLGTSAAVREREQAAGSQEEANRWSVALELQADCYAGVWAHSVYERGEEDPQGDVGLDEGDIEEGLAAAEAVGDDRIQAQAGMDVNPESWTHGSSAQRREWFQRGFDSGDPDSCDTFAG